MREKNRCQVPDQVPWCRLAGALPTNKDDYHHEGEKRQNFTQQYSINSIFKSFSSLLFIKIISTRYVVPDTPGQQHSLLAGLDVNPLEGWDPAKVVRINVDD